MIFVQHQPFHCVSGCGFIIRLHIYQILIVSSTYQEFTMVYVSSCDFFLVLTLGSIWLLN